MKKLIILLFSLLIILSFSFYPFDCFAGDVTLAWNPVDSATGYKIYYAKSTGETDLAAPYDGTLAVEGFSPVDVGNLTEVMLSKINGPYKFAVTACNEYGESAYSVPVGAIIPLDAPVFIWIDCGSGQTPIL